MTHDELATTSTQAAEIAQLGAIIGPVIPYAIWWIRRDRDAFVAREAARATNFGVLVLAAFAASTAIRVLVPFVGFLGTVGQLAVVASSVVLCLQAYSAVRRGVPSSYPIEIKVVKTHG